MVELIKIEGQKSKVFSKETWDKFIDTIDFNSEVNNFKLDFKNMTKKCGQQYIDYCINSWLTNFDILSEEEFCRINANMPLDFFKNKIKPKQDSGDSK